MATARFVYDHPIASRDRPGALARWIRWQIGSRLLPGAALVPFVDDAVLLVEPGMAGATGVVYVGLPEFEDMAFVLHFLRPADLLLDIGANVGVYSVLAAAVCGARAMAIEPVPSTFARLSANLRVNGIEIRVDAKNVGVASHAGTLTFTSMDDTVNRVVVTADSATEATVAVEVTTVDALAAAVKPALIKIDVEGFESEVLAGGQTTFSSPDVEAIVIELNGSGSRYGFSDADVDRRLRSSGFAPFRYEPRSRELHAISGAISTTGNTLYLRDAERARSRVQSAPRRRVLGVEL
jgi:FkbM family methyltransferase